MLGDPAALTVTDGVAIVGARRATGYGLEVARALGRGLSLAGVPVVSGLALGVDAAAHQGALEGHGRPIAVLAAAPQVAYPSRNRVLHAAVAERGAVVSELPPGASAFRWCFVARNRIVAALAQIAVIVEAAGRSGSLTTADFAADLGCTVAAVPGRVTNRTAAGTNGLIQSGAALVRDSARRARPARRGHRRGPPDARPARSLRRAPELRGLLAAVEDGAGALGELASSPRGGQGRPRRARRARVPRPGPPHVRRSLRARRCLTLTRVPQSARTRRVLSIAGSDSGGGAGIQADLKAFARCGVHGMTAITAITAQSTVGVEAVHPIPPELIVAQVRAVADDIGVDAVKIGMLGTSDTVCAVRDALEYVGDARS